MEPRTPEFTGTACTEIAYSGTAALIWQSLHAPNLSDIACFGGSARRLGLTPALTGTALAARSRGDKRMNDDTSSKDYLQGCVRRRMLRLGQDAHAFCWSPPSDWVLREWKGLEIPPSFAPDDQQGNAAVAPHELGLIAKDSPVLLRCLPESIRKLYQ
jgi:hypothetical protein